MSMLSIDLNCDLGEGSGPQPLKPDLAIMPYISSANIACGFHAGNPGIMMAIVESAKQNNVAIGAHPGLDDKQGFGRKEIDIPQAEVYQLMLYQLGALDAFTRAAGTRLHHVKPHGALYNMSAKNINIAGAIARAIADFDHDLLLYALADSCSVAAATNYGLSVVQEGFADRRYQANGQLVPRSSPGSLLVEPSQVDAQLMSIVLHKQVSTIEGHTINLNVDTICIHSDTTGAQGNAQRIHQLLQTAEIELKAPQRNEK